MLEWLAKYWLEVLFGAIVSGGAFLFKHHLKLIREARERHDRDLIDTIDKKLDKQQDAVKAELAAFDQRLDTQKVEMQSQMSSCYANLISVVDKRDDGLLEADKGIREDIKSLKDEFGSVKSGMLTVQGRAFKDECHRLLDDDHIITLIEYENILAEHITYKQLGGNHEGDSLFAMVEAKYKHNLTQTEKYYVGGKLNV